MGVSGSRMRTVYAEPTSVSYEHTGPVNCMVMSDDESLLVTGSDDYTAKMWSAKSSSLNCLGTLKGHTNSINSLSIFDTYIISGSNDKTIRKWCMTSLNCIHVFEGHSGRVLRTLCTGDFIFSSSTDKTVKAWKFDPSVMFNDGIHSEDTVVQTFTGHVKAIIPMIFIPALNGVSQECEGLNINAGDLLITGSADSTARSWDFESGVQLTVFKGHTKGITCMVADNSGQILYTGSEDGDIISWLIGSGTKMKVMKGYEYGITALTIVNRMLYSGGQDGLARSWAREFGDCTRVYRGHTPTESITVVKFYRGQLFTACADGKARSIDAKSGQINVVYDFHSSSVTCLTLVGDIIYTGSNDGTICSWPVLSRNDIDDDDCDDFSTEQNRMLYGRSGRKGRSRKSLSGYDLDDVDLDSVPAIIVNG